MNRTSKLLNYFDFIKETKGTQTPISFRMWFIQRILGFNKSAYWPMHHSSIVDIPSKVICGIETCPGFMPGCYIQSMNGIIIGDYTQISANVGLISGNHDMLDNRKHILTKPIKIGKYCWIGMNVVILPGVELGDFTIVGAGAIVTKSFPGGYCVIGGNPAKEIKKLNKEDCVEHRSKIEYNGYIKSKNFKIFKKRYLNIDEN
jgi:acetyltransferase-like isoleucine patch superfamily enzyme